MTYTPGQFSKLPPLATVTLPCCSLLHRRRDSCRHSSWSTLACQVPLHVTGVHTCGLRTLNPNRPGNSLKMQIGLQAFRLTWSGMPWKLLSPSSWHLGVTATSGNPWVKAGGAGDLRRALGQGTKTETPAPLAACCVTLGKLLPLSVLQHLPKWTRSRFASQEVSKPQPGGMMVTLQAEV